MPYSALFRHISPPAPPHPKSNGSQVLDPDQRSALQAGRDTSGTSNWRRGPANRRDGQLAQRDCQGFLKISERGQLPADEEVLRGPAISRFTPTGVLSKRSSSVPHPSDNRIRADGDRKFARRLPGTLRLANAHAEQIPARVRIAIPKSRDMEVLEDLGDVGFVGGVHGRFAGSGILPPSLRGTKRIRLI